MRRFAALAALAAWLALAGAAPAQVVINELMYHPAEPWPIWTPAKQTNRTEYVELYNAGTQSVDLAGYRFDNGVVFDFPAGCTLATGAYLVVCKDLKVFTSRYPTVTNAIGDFSGDLANEGERVTLSRLSSSGTWDTVDTIAYLDYGRSDGEGPSLELVHPAFAVLQDQFQGDWLDSTAPSGTPGRVNSVYRSNALPVVGDVAHSPALPPANSAVRISARVAWANPAAPGTVRVRYRKNTAPPSAWSEAAMNDLAGDGLYSGALPEHGQAPMAEGEALEFRIVAMDGAGAATHPITNRAGVTTGDYSYFVKFGEDRYADCAYPGEYPTYHILVTATNKLWRETPANTNLFDDTLLDATLVTSDGQIVYGCGWRYRGNTTRVYPYGGYRLELPRGRLIDGFDELNFDWSYWIQNFIGMRVLDAAGYGCGGSDVQLTRIWVNDDLKLANSNPAQNLYVRVERFRADMMRRRYPEPIGNLYWTDRTERRGNLEYYNTISSYYPLYYNDTNYPPSMWLALSNLCWALDQPVSAYPTVLSNRVNVRQWARFFAAYCALGHPETKEWRLYEDPRDGQFDLYSWDYDAALRTDAAVWYWNNPIVADVVFNPPAAPYYAGDVLDIIDNVMSQENMAALLAGMGSKVAGHAQGYLNTIGSQRSNLHAKVSTAMTVSVGGIPATGSAVILPPLGGAPPWPVAVTGTASQAYTARVLVNGQDAYWNLMTNAWATTNAVLVPAGVSTLAVETLDPEGRRLHLTNVVVVAAANRQSRGGAITADTVWDGSAGLNLVVGDVTVSNGARLTIAGGAAVAFGAGRRLTVSSGTLLLNGTAENPVHLYATNGPADWAIEATGSGSAITGRWVVAGGGRLAAGGGARLDLQDATLAQNMAAAGIVSASNAAAVYLGRCVASNFAKTAFINTPLLIEDSLFTHMADCGVEVATTAAALIRRTTVENSAGTNAVDGLRLVGSPSAVVSNCQLRGLSGAGLSGGGTVTHSLIAGCGTGVAAVTALTNRNNSVSDCTIGLQGAAVAARNLIVWGNGASVTNGPASVSYSDVEQPGTNLYPGTANLNRNPWFRSAADGDYRLLPISPCLSAGEGGGAQGAVFPSGADPAAPDGLTLTNVTDAAIELRWRDNSADEAGFEVQRSADGAAWEAITNTAAGATNWTDMALSQGREYAYRVRAFHGRGRSLFSETATAATPPATTTALLRQYLRLTEIMYNPPAPPPGNTAFGNDDFEFLEFENTGLSPLDLSGLYFDSGLTFAFSNGTVLAAGARFTLVRNAAAFASRYTNVTFRGVFQAGKLDNDGERLRIRDAGGNTILDVTYDSGADDFRWYPACDGSGYSLVLADPAGDMSAASTWRASTAWGGSPGAADPAPALGTVLINEVLAHQDVEPPGDWIELYNAGSNAVSIGGWYLSDDAGNLKRFPIPSNTVMAAGEYRVFTESADFGTNAMGTNGFALSELGDSVYLSSASNGTLTSYRAYVQFGATANGVTLGRHTRSDGQVDFTALGAGTPGASNAYPRVGPVVINEVMYNPAAGGKEFVELFNAASTNVPLYDPAHPTNTWQFNGAMEFAFPTNVSLVPGEHLLVVSIAPQEFRSLFGLTNAALKVFGPFDGALANSGETVKLYAPGAPEADGSVPYILADRVQYEDRAPWPEAADNGGASLEKIEAGDYGNDPANWMASTLGGTPGAANNATRQPTAGFLDPAGRGLETNATVAVAVRLWPASAQTVTVAYAVSGGTASSGADYAAADGTLVFWPYDTLKTIPLTIKDDGLQEPDETVQLSLTAVSANAKLGGNRAYTYTIADTDGTLPAPVIAPAGTNLFTNAVTVAISSSPPGAVVRYTLDGSRPTADSPLYTAPLTLTQSARVTARTFLGSFLAGANNASALFLEQTEDMSPSWVTLAATDDTATEAGPTAGLFTVSRGTNTSGNLVVTYAIGGTASNGVDYAALSGSVTISNGQTAATVTVAPVDDSLVEDAKTVDLSLTSSGTNYFIGSPLGGTVTIVSDDGPTVTLAATDDTATEAGPTAGLFTVNRGTNTGGNLVVTYTISGTASNGEDYAALPGSVTISNGQTAATITVMPIADTLLEPDETVILALAASTNYMRGAPSGGTVTIANNEEASVRRIVWNRTQANDSWAALRWNDVYSQSNRVPLSRDAVYVGDVTIDTRATGNDIAPAVAGSLQVGWRAVDELGTTQWDDGNLVVYGDAGDNSLTVTGTLYVANGQGKYGKLRQEGGIIAVGGDMKTCYGANIGVSSNDFNGGSLQINGNLFLGDLGTNGVDFNNANGSAVDFDQAGGTTVSVGGDIRGNRGASSSAPVRTYRVNDGATLSVAGGMKFGGCFRMDSAGAVTVGGNVELCKDSSRTTAVINVSGGLFTVGGLLDLNEPGQGQVNLSGGTLRANNLDVKTAAANKLSISGTGELLVRQSNYAVSNAHADITAGDVTGVTTANVSTVSVGGTNYTRVSLVPAADANGNGLPDTWELRYFGNLTNSATGDNDGDGLDNYGEWVSGTDPTNAQSLLAFTNLTQSVGNWIVVRWSSESNRFYTLKLSTNLLLDLFTTVLTNRTAATPPQNVHTDAVERPGGAFYRITVENQ